MQLGASQPGGAKYLVLVLMLAAAFSPANAAKPPEPAPVRGVWVANIGPGPLSSASKSREFVELCKNTGINTICVVVWNRGLTVYPSEIMEREFGVRCDPRYQNRDALRDIIEVAHAEGLRVYAWFEFGFAASYGKRDGGHILRRKPQWAAIDRDGNLVSKNNFQWMNAFDPQVQDFMLSLILEVATKYEVDGIQGDDRLPALPSSAGYDKYTSSMYALEHAGKSPPNDPRQASWVDWRASKLNEFAERMYHRIKAVDEHLVVAAAPSIYPWSKFEYLQDWPTWIREGYVDVVSPQVYRDNLTSYKSELQKIITRQVPPEKLKDLFPGILVRTADGYRISDNLLEQMILANRSQNIPGEILFYDSALMPHRETIATLYLHSIDSSQSSKTSQSR